MTNEFIFECRPNTLDKFVIDEVCSQETYGKLQLRNTDIVLDAGGNIGAFSVWASKRVSKMIAYEPDEENMSILCKHLNLNKVMNVWIEQKALWSTTGTIEFFVNSKKNKGTHTVLPTRGRAKILVHTDSFDDVLLDYKITVAKLDIEGAEYEILRTSKNLHMLREIIIEFHHSALKDKDNSKFNEIISILKDTFSHVEYEEDPPSKIFGISIIYARK